MSDQDTGPEPERAPQGASREALGVPQEQQDLGDSPGPSGLGADMLALQGLIDEVVESRPEVRAPWGQGVGQNTHGGYVARGAGREWHGQAVGQDSLGAGAAEGLSAMSQEALGLELGDAEAQPPLGGGNIETQTYAHVNSMPEDPELLAQLSPTNRKLRLRTLGARHEVLARLVAAGASDAELSRVVGRYSQTRLSTIRKSPRFIMRVQQIQEKFFGAGVEGRMKRIGMRALDVAETMIGPYTTASQDLQFKVAKDMMDRAYGKAKETVKVESNTVVDLFAALDQLKRDGSDLTLAAMLQTQAKPAQNKVDAWVEEIVPETSGIGAPKPSGEAS